jgi:hypothetical protein
MIKYTHSILATVIMASVPVSAYAGNGAPSGSHYNLNIIGVQKGKSAEMSGSNGHVIFTNLTGNTKIGLAEGADFKVLDANGTDGSAKFQMPSPDPDGDGVTVYSVYVRALGKPGGSAKMTTCATDPLTGEEICSVNSVTVKRSAGKQSFSNVSKQLLYIQVDIDGDGDIDSVPLFDDRLQDYLWSYDNSGLKLLQMRFYPQATNTN